jgi:hypothetical protein
MTNQYLLEGGVDKLIKEGKNGAARIIEKGIDIFLLQAFNNDLRTRLLHKRLRYWSAGVLEY